MSSKEDNLNRVFFSTMTNKGQGIFQTYSLVPERIETMFFFMSPSTLQMLKTKATKNQANST